jgi:hypothetical protein
MRSAFARFPWCCREDARKWRRGSDAGGMCICETSGVDAEVEMEGCGVGWDSISASEDEAFGLRSDSDPTRNSSTSLL